MKLQWLLLAVFLPAPALTNTVTPTWSTGSMQSTTTTSQTIEETIQHQIYGSEMQTWTGEGVTPSAADITNTATTWDLTTDGDPFTLEITTREADYLIEQIDIDRTIETDSTTTSLSVFSQ
tara:strand:- start:1081 stop:1443 length:363 start_codon:yes stop_codon:yes gene_type:complete